MKRTLFGLALSALVTLFFIWLITFGFGQLMSSLRGLTQPGGQGGSAVTMLIVGLAVFVPLLIYRIRKARQKQRKNKTNAA
ncbi:hypothetical protein [Roseateles sp.]|uniref:hypothetical protein n=1 Tax=Roseateles sp. TaxID=1971397 RepID=UPI002F40D977